MVIKSTFAGWTKHLSVELRVPDYFSHISSFSFISLLEDICQEHWATLLFMPFYLLSWVQDKHIFKVRKICELVYITVYVRLLT